MNFDKFQQACPWKDVWSCGDIFCSGNNRLCINSNCAPVLAANMMRISMTPVAPSAGSGFKPAPKPSPIASPATPTQPVPWTPVIGEEVECPDGIGRVKSIGPDHIQVATHFNNRECKWGWTNVKPWKK